MIHLALNPLWSGGEAMWTLTGVDQGVPGHMGEPVCVFVYVFWSKHYSEIISVSYVFKSYYLKIWIISISGKKSKHWEKNVNIGSELHTVVFPAAATSLDDHLFVPHIFFPLSLKKKKKKKMICLGPALSVRHGARRIRNALVHLSWWPQGSIQPWIQRPVLPCILLDQWSPRSLLARKRSESKNSKTCDEWDLWKDSQTHRPCEQKPKKLCLRLWKKKENQDTRAHTHHKGRSGGPHINQRPLWWVTPVVKQWVQFAFCISGVGASSLDSTNQRWKTFFKKIACVLNANRLPFLCHYPLHNIVWPLLTSS